MEKNKQQKLRAGSSKARRKGTVDDTRRGLKHGPNRRKEDYNTPSGYRDGRDDKRAVKKEDRRKNKGRRKRYICESPGRSGKKAEKRRSSDLRE
jgi:hypothetical protein